MTTTDVRPWPLVSSLYMKVMHQGPLSSTTIVMARENLVHASMIAGSPTAAPSPQVGDPAPDFRLLTADGTPRSLSHFAGRPLVLAFSRAINTTMVCPFSMRAMVELKDIYDDFAAAGVELAVVFPTTPEGGADILAAHDLPYPAYADPQWEAFTAYGSGHILFGPFQMYAVVDAERVVRWLWRPEDDRNDQDTAGVTKMPLPSAVLAVARQLADR